MPPSSVKRHVKGLSVIGLVKILKVHRRNHSLPALSAGLETLFVDRVLLTEWYPIELLWELLGLTYREMLKQDPDRLIEIGAAGSQEALSGPHRAFAGTRGILETLHVMGPVWSNYYDFGSLTVEELERGVVRFTVHDYPDIPMTHGLVLAGWHLGAARVAGAHGPRVEFVQSPWQGAARQVHLVHYDGDRVE
ncbi:MAG: hypothetical protein OEZ06_03040 [Myxococcales bacterium]|nr:hypothetical protein [Myxococcales bacterium]